MVVGTLIMSSGGALWHDVISYRMQTLALGGATGYWIGVASVGVIVIWVVRELLVRQQIPLTATASQAAFGGAMIVALISLKAPGIGVTVVMLLLGYANANRMLTGLGILSLLAYWSYYYYSLQMTLLQKSALLVCAGAALIIARLAMQRRWPVAEKADLHA
jgi:uncharacterized membrane protein